MGFVSCFRIKTASTEELEMVVGKSKAELLVLYFKQVKSQTNH